MEEKEVVENIAIELSENGKINLFCCDYNGTRLKKLSRRVEE